MCRQLQKQSEMWHIKGNNIKEQAELVLTVLLSARRLHIPSHTQLEPGQPTQEH